MCERERECVCVHTCVCVGGVFLCVCLHIIPYVNCFARTLLCIICIEYHI